MRFEKIPYAPTRLGAPIFLAHICKYKKVHEKSKKKIWTDKSCNRLCLVKFELE
jgi:hypothetical protein